MTQDEFIEMAIQAGFDEHHAKFDTRIKNFAKLVAAHTLMNIDATSFISHQEGIEVGRLAEREACAKLSASTICDTHIPTGVKIYGTVAAKAIRARGQA